MNEQGGYIVSIKTSDSVAFDKLSSKYHIDLFHTAAFDEQKKEFTIDGIISLDQIGQLVRDGYRVEVKAYHPVQGLPSSQIMHASEWLKEFDEKDKLRRSGDASYIEGGESLPQLEYFRYDDLSGPICNKFDSLFPNIAGFTIEGVSHERIIWLIKLSDGSRTRGVLFLGGLHARELINPDALVSLAFDLCYAYTERKGISYGGKSYSFDIIKRIFDTFEIFIMPLVNPDGREHVFNFYDLWRMNRNPNGGRTCPTPPTPDCPVDGKGVDINRNFDFLWKSGINTTSDPCLCDQRYKGEMPFSEPESSSVRTLLDRNAHIDSMVDVHSYAERVLYPWQIDEDQVTDSNMNFQNPFYDGKRGYMTDSYQEYIRGNELVRYRFVAEKVRDAINDVRGNRYQAQQGPYFPIYPASGTSTDYAISRNFVSQKKTKIFAMAFETAMAFNPLDPYSPMEEKDDKWKITKEICAGLIEFMYQTSRPND
jgi:Zinc carboxypeptidase